MEEIESSENLEDLSSPAETQEQSVMKAIALETVTSSEAREMLAVELPLKRVLFMVSIGTVGCFWWVPREAGRE